MKIALVLITIIAISALVMGGCAERFKTPEKRAEYFTQKIEKQLDLNDEQRAKLAIVKDEILTIRNEMRGKHEATHASVRDLLNASSLNQEKAITLVNGHVSEISNQAPRAIAALGGFWDSLNPEQQAKVREKMDEHFEQRSHWGRSCRYSM